jgi:hypothetical protein
MFRRIDYILMLVLLLLPVLSYAQEQDNAIDTLRSIIEPPPVYEESERYNESPFLPITQQAPVAVRSIPDGKVEALKKEDDYWYANIVPEKIPEKTTTDITARKRGLLDQRWLQNLLWTIILFSFIGIIIWYLASSNIHLFRKESKKIIEEEGDDEYQEDIFSIHYDKEIRKAEQAGNYRLAIRLWYLKTLRELADRNIIAYRHEKTDNDYVHSLHGSRFYRDFFRLTRNFEYTWYGQFSLSPEAYSIMQADYFKFNNSLS